MFGPEYLHILWTTVVPLILSWMPCKKQLCFGCSDKTFPWLVQTTYKLWRVWRTTKPLRTLQEQWGSVCLQDRPDCWLLTCQTTVSGLPCTSSHSPAYSSTPQCTVSGLTVCAFQPLFSLLGCFDCGKVCDVGAGDSRPCKTCYTVCLIVDMHVWNVWNSLSQSTQHLLKGSIVTQHGPNMTWPSPPCGTHACSTSSLLLTLTLKHEPGQLTLQLLDSLWCTIPHMHATRAQHTNTHTHTVL